MPEALIYCQVIANKEDVFVIGSQNEYGGIMITVFGCR